MVLVKCKECGAEISQKASACPKCGAPMTKKTTLFTWVVTVFLGLFLIVYILYLIGSHDDSASLANRPKPPETAYPAQRNLDYRAAALGQLSKGILINVTGKIAQRIGTTNARLATKQLEYVGYMEDDVYLTFESQPQILDDDIIRVLGRYEGTITYETVLHTERVIPKIRVDYFKVIRER